MKKVLFLLIVFVAVMGVLCAEGRVIPGLTQPTGIRVDDSQLYVVEDATVQIYDLKSLKKISQFGKAGQGPKEFQIVPGQLPLILSVHNQELVVTSLGKISRWSKKGEYISEQAFNLQNALNAQILKNGQFIGLGITQGEGQKAYRTVFLCDEKMNRIKEIYKAPHIFQGAGKGLVALDKVFLYITYEDQIYLPGKEDNQVAVYSLDMQPKYTVSIPKDNRSVDQAFKDRYMAELNADPNIKNQMEFLKPIIFPDKYPAISFFDAEGKMLFVFNWNFGKESLEYYSFDNTNGKALGKGQVPIKFQGSLSPYPVVFYKGIVYQLVENDDEEWELISSPLK
jgi:hypothetical protein